MAEPTKVHLTWKQTGKQTWCAFSGKASIGCVMAHSFDEVGNPWSWGLSVDESYGGYAPTLETGKKLLARAFGIWLASASLAQKSEVAP